MTYSRIRNALSAVFSIQTGLDDQAAAEMYKRSIERNIDLREEVRQAFNDPSVSWRSLLFNDEYEVIEIDTEQEARQRAMSLLLEPIEDFEKSESGKGGIQH